MTVDSGLHEGVWILADAIRRRSSLAMAQHKPGVWHHTIRGTTADESSANAVLRPAKLTAEVRSTIRIAIPDVGP